ncbi:MAG: hydroxymethylglutaryl-CoA reductase, degradative [Candidatus Heimdallarchaeota archaeon]|nr:hydroxymethylglutaryl-CoA reductase, degradative [Candidatus Heimdallarchaeota archaeon]MCK4955197.1 hydroxymethylglutaryl-CoA reductase, degradative [Candidatus Heimdallarchaeota archaeon]
MPISSRITDFYNKSIEERREHIAEILGLSIEDIHILRNSELSEDISNILIENVIGSISLPLGIATNFIVNGKEHLVPMVIEESSVVAAASHGAKIARKKGGFTSEYTGSYVIGQIQILGISDFDIAKKVIKENHSLLLEIANSTNQILLDLGGGAKDIELRQVGGQLGDYLLLHLIVDTKDAMGANAVNTMLEKLQPKIEELTNGKVLLRIVSNYALKRMVKVKAVFDKEELGGEDVVNRILIANDLAQNDKFRAVTHNKGIMNGIIAVLLATGNDTRAVEAGIHAYAARDGRYSALTEYEKNSDGDLVGYLEIPLSIGILGGAINVNPSYKLALKILNIKDVEVFTNIVGAIGLAQNLAALRALVSEGIQKGHMRLHARNIAMTVGAKGDEIKKIANQLLSEENISHDRAKEILKTEK